MSEKNHISMCAWCPGKEEKHEKAEKDWKIITHNICQKCKNEMLGIKWKVDMVLA